MPLYRQAQVFARHGVAIERSTLADWVGRAAFHLAPIVERMAELLKRSSKLFMDETTAPVLDPGRGKTKTGYLWALARDDRSFGGTDPPGVVFRYAPGRGGLHAEEMLTGFDGVLQVDGYAGYNRLQKADRQGGSALRLAYCWSHGRREVINAIPEAGSPIGDEILQRIASLYAIEKQIRGTFPEQRRAVRQQRAKPLIAELEAFIRAQRERLSPKSNMGQALLGPSGFAHRHLQAQWHRAVRLHEGHARGAGRRSSQRRNRSAAAVEFQRHAHCSGGVTQPLSSSLSATAAAKLCNKYCSLCCKRCCHALRRKRPPSIRNPMWPAHCLHPTHPSKRFQRHHGALRLVDHLLQTQPRHSRARGFSNPSLDSD